MIGATARELGRITGPEDALAIARILHEQDEWHVLTCDEQSRAVVDPSYGPFRAFEDLSKEQQWHYFARAQQACDRFDALRMRQRDPDAIWRIAAVEANTYAAAELRAA